MRIFLLLFLLFISAESFAEVKLMYFREKDGATQHLYYAACRSGKPATCSLKVMSVSTDKSPRACFVTYQSLFQDEIASNPQKDSFTVSVSRGACGYTNTYVISPSGLIQTKTSPTNVAENLEGVCEAFPPKTYKADVNPEDRSGFINVPTGNCKSINVILE